MKIHLLISMCAGGVVLIGCSPAYYDSTADAHGMNHYANANAYNPGPQIHGNPTAPYHSRTTDRYSNRTYAQQPSGTYVQTTRPTAGGLTYDSKGLAYYTDPNTGRTSRASQYDRQFVSNY